jgi:hypothetical protein
VTGGGGGSVGSTIQVSTIQFGPGQFGLGTIDVTNTSTLAINNNATAAINDIIFTTNNNQFDTPANYIEINSPDSANSLKFIAQDNGNNGIVSQQGSLALGAESTIIVAASSISLLAPTSISSLTVSSINGAVPGGGGSVGPDLNVSTLSFPLGNQTTAGAINMISSLAFNDANTPVIQDIIFFTNYPVSTRPALSPYVSTVNVIQVNGPGGDGATAELKIGGSADGRSLIASLNGDGNPSTLTVLADSVNMPTNLNVSTINAGSLSTLAIGGSVAIFNDLACSAISTNSITPVSGTIVTISSISVSSINGVAPGGGGSLYPVVSTILPGGGGVQTQYFTSTGALIQVLTAFSTQVGHNYMLSLPFNVSTFNAPAYGDVITFATQGAGADDYQYTLPLIQAGAWNFPISFKNKIGDGGVAVILEANTAYPVEVNLGDSDGAELVDLGPST